MAADGSWPSIRDNGLLTTAQQVERCAPPKEVADSILRSRRSQIIWLTTPDGIRVAVRDQKPLLLHNLVLEGTDLQGWLDILNSRVFFWVNKERLDKLLRARAYRSSPHHVIVVDTASLVSKHADQIRLSPFNTGATIFPPPSAPLRGPGTFQTLRDYRWASRVRLDGSRTGYCRAHREGFSRPRRRAATACLGATYGSRGCLFATISSPANSSACSGSLSRR
jgi:hypothetical protein